HSGVAREVAPSRVGRPPHARAQRRVPGKNPVRVLGLGGGPKNPPAILHPRRRADDRNGAWVQHFVDRRHLWFCPELHDTPSKRTWCVGSASLRSTNGAAIGRYSRIIG